ncbi:hypothetical protein EYF80_049023 [Liparis tanakae]|uniref:Uncharacterized protein n=1 Tax=Liparis tanakae TaxID=230148 RepID=A0A4Z2FIR1_9TELE|nr:hypothetical protein EYF80_049023 [Liparis tanakae]
MMRYSQRWVSLFIKRASAVSPEPPEGSSRVLSRGAGRPLLASLRTLGRGRAVVAFGKDCFILAVTSAEQVTHPVVYDQNKETDATKTIIEAQASH